MHRFAYSRCVANFWIVLDCCVYQSFCRWKSEIANCTSKWGPDYLTRSILRIVMQFSYVFCFQFNLIVCVHTLWEYFTCSVEFCKSPLFFLIFSLLTRLNATKSPKCTRHFGTEVSSKKTILLHFDNFFQCVFV